VGQLAQGINERQNGALSSNTERNPIENTKTIILRSGKKVGKHQFELMCNSNNYVIGASHGQRKDGIFRAIYYASLTLSKAQLNYAIELCHY